MKHASLLFYLVLAFGCRSSQSALKADEAKHIQAPKNIVLLIGDGMGISQISAGMFANQNSIAFERMGVVGLHKSYSHDNLVTDSAAGATAFSCGKKTYNGAIGVTPDTTACKTLLELASSTGRSTGLIATSTIVHATPASFYAHEPSRKNYENIAEQLAESSVDFFVGGGAKFFRGRKKDDRDLIAEMVQGGRVVSSYFDAEVDTLTINPSERFGFLTSNGEPLPRSQGRNYLLPATQQGLTYLNSRNGNAEGFFLMIEGSQIDWGGHANDSEYIISETIEFSKVVDAVLDFAERDKETLVVVTADHETGGYAINYGSTMDSIKGAFTSDYHTADLIPVFAHGPGASRFAGIYENTALFTKLKGLMFSKDLASKE